LISKQSCFVSSFAIKAGKRFHELNLISDLDTYMLHGFSGNPIKKEKTDYKRIKMIVSSFF